MTNKEKQIQRIIKTSRQLICECVKEAPNLHEVEKITGEKYTEIKQKPFWQVMSYAVDPNGSNHLKATHLAVLATAFQIQEIFGHLVFVYAERLDYGSKEPIEKELFGLYVVLQKLHEVQQAVEKQKLSLC